MTEVLESPIMEEISSLIKEMEILEETNKDIEIWNASREARWDSAKLRSLLEQAKDLKYGGAIQLAIEIEIETEYKIILLKLCVSNLVSVPVDIWIYIINMTSHMEYLKPGQLFAKDLITFRVEPDYCGLYYSYYKVEINQICYFDNEEQYYMITEINHEYETITCVELESWLVERDYNLYEMTIYPDSLIRIFTFKEFYCQENTIYDDYYDPSKRHKKLNSSHYF